MTNPENYTFKSDFEEAVESIEKITSFTTLCKMKKVFENCRSEVRNGRFYYMARKNCYITVFDVVLSDGMKIAEVTCEGNCDNVPREEQEAFAESYISEVGRLIAILDEKVRLAEIKEKKYEKASRLCFIVIFACMIAIFLVTLHTNPIQCSLLYDFVANILS